MTLRLFQIGTDNSQDNFSFRLWSDSNRPNIEGKPVKDSLRTLKGKERAPRVLLMVPPYTRRSKSLDLIEDSLRQYNNGHFNDDLQFINGLRKKGITDLEETKRAGQPIGLMQIAVQLKEKECGVHILDIPYQGWNNDAYLFTAEEGSRFLRYGLSKDHIEERIRSFDPDIVGISCIYTNQYSNAVDMVNLAKSIDQKIITVVGGGVPTALPDSFLNGSSTDYVIKGQGDHSLCDLIETLQRGDNLSSVHGIVYKEEGNTKSTTRDRALRASEIKIDYGLIDLETYSGPYHSGGKRARDDGKLAVVFATRGCDTGCNFCSIPGMQGGFTEVGPTRFGQTLDELVDRGVTEVIIEDDNLMHDPSRLMEYCGELQKRNISWFEEGGISAYGLTALLPECTEEELADLREEKGGENTFRKILQSRKEGITAEKVIKKMSESDCYHIYLAVESENNESLIRSHKPSINTNEQYVGKIIHLLNQYKINVTVGLMLGFVNSNGGYHIESREEIHKTINYGARLRQYGEKGKVWINPFIFTPIVSAPHFKKLSGVTEDNAELTGSHEWCSINYEKITMKTKQTAISCADELNLLRVRALVECNGMDSYIIMRKTGTWPMDREK